jgi:mTERF domain-containing protein
MAFNFIARTLLAQCVYRSSVSHKRNIVTGLYNNKLTVCTSAAVLPASTETLAEKILVEKEAENSRDILKQWGCSDDQISEMFSRRPSLRACNIKNLRSRLKAISEMGLTSSDLVKIIHCRPRFLSSTTKPPSNYHLECLREFFGCSDVLNKAIIRNPSLLTYDFDTVIKPIVDLYKNVGISRLDMIQMAISRPMLIPRSSLSDEKMDYIRKSKLSTSSKMYKHLVTIIAVSKLQTIHEKIANIVKFGLSVDEVMVLIGKNPLLLTLSTEKVQRNMTFAIGIMKLEASVILNFPKLLYLNLESVLKPRFHLAAKIEEMGIHPQMKGPDMLKAIRMKEKRFCEAFINCHDLRTSCELMDFYKKAKNVKRIGAYSFIKTYRKCYPF